MEIEYSVIDFNNIEDFVCVDVEKRIDLKGVAFDYVDSFSVAEESEVIYLDKIINEIREYYLNNRSYMRRVGEFYFAHLFRKFLWSLKNQEEKGFGFEFDEIISDYRNAYSQLVEHKEIKVNSAEYYNLLRVEKFKKEKEKTKVRGWYG